MESDKSANCKQQRKNKTRTTTRQIQQMKSMPSSDLKEYSVRLTAMQMLIQKLQNLAFLLIVTELQHSMQANSKEELLDKIKNVDWDSIKSEENKIGGRFDFSV